MILNERTVWKVGNIVSLANTSYKRLRAVFNCKGSWRPMISTSADPCLRSIELSDSNRVHAFAMYWYCLAIFCRAKTVKHIPFMSGVTFFHVSLMCT